MDNFEKQFENLDLLDKVLQDTMEGAMTTGGATAQVDELIGKVAAENDLQEQLEIMKAPEAKKEYDLNIKLYFSFIFRTDSSKTAEADDLTKRLQALRN